MMGMMGIYVYLYIYIKQQKQNIGICLYFKFSEMWDFQSKWGFHQQDTPRDYRGGVLSLSI
jgi:hypothetical protein